MLWRIQLLVCLLSCTLRFGWVEENGVVNDRFAELISGEPDYVVKSIEGYLADIEMILFELSRNGESSKIDFSMVASLAHEIEDKSASIGAAHMMLAFSELLKTCNEMNKRKFILSLTWLKTEFTQTKNKLEAVVRMEQRIIRVQSSQ